MNEPVENLDPNPEKKRQEYSIRQIALLVLAIAATAIPVLYLTLIVSMWDTTDKQAEVIDAISFELDALLERQDRMDQALNIYAEIVEKTSEIDFAEFAAAGISASLENQQVQITAIEGLLDTEPREVIEVLRLRDQVSQLQLQIVRSNEATEHDLDQMFTLILSTIAAFLVAVMILVLQNIFATRKEE